MNVIKASDLINLFDSWKQLFAEQREFLIALDGKVDKTLLDVLDPIAVTLEAQAAAGASLTDALAAAAKAAEDALEATKTMVAQHGKAAAFQEKTIGLQDAGATVGMLLITSMSAFVSANT